MNKETIVWIDGQLCDLYYSDWLIEELCKRLIEEMDNGVVPPGED